MQLRHAAFAEFFEDFVVRDGFTDHFTPSTFREDRQPTASR